MNVNNVVKPLHIAVLSKYISEHIQERNHMNVNNVVKPLQEAVVSNAIKDHIQERHHMNVTNVVKPLQEGVTFKEKRPYRRETLCRYLML